MKLWVLHQGVIRGLCVVVFEFSFCILSYSILDAERSSLSEAVDPRGCF